MVINDLSDRLCLFEGDEAGHKGFSFGGPAAARSFLVDGVRDGTQNDGSLGSAAFSSSMAFLAFARSSTVFFSISSSSIPCFLFTPRASAASWVLAPSLALATPPFPSKPISVLSKSFTVLARSSSSRSLFSSSKSRRPFSNSFSRRLISLRWLSRLLTAHSRQNISPLLAHATGSRAICRQS